MNSAASTSRGPYKKSTLTRQKVIEAAMTVFAADGYRHGSTTDIAALAGISVPQIFYYFPTKEALLDAVLEGRDTVSDEVAGPVPDDPSQIPDAFLRIAANNERSPESVSLYSLLVAESTSPGHPANEYFRDRYRRVRARFEGVFRQMEDAGMLAAGVDAAYAATSTLALWDGIQLQWLVEPESIDVVEHLRRHLAQITRVGGD